mgnify:CR=1 FL=1
MGSLICSGTCYDYTIVHKCEAREVNIFSPYPNSDSKFHRSLHVLVKGAGLTFLNLQDRKAVGDDQF